MKKFLLFFAAAAMTLSASAALQNKAANAMVKFNKVKMAATQATAQSPKRIIDIEPEGEAKAYLQNAEGIYVYSGYLYSGLNSFSDGSIVFDADGATVYIKNILPNTASYWNEGDYWVEGQLSADGKKITVPLGQEIYYDSYYDDTLILSWGATSVDDEGYIVYDPIEKESVEFSVNEDGSIILDGGKGDIYAEELDAFVGEGLCCEWIGDGSFGGENSWAIKFTDLSGIKPAKPADPTITSWYDSGSETGFSRLSFNIPLQDVDGNVMIAENVSYSIFTDNDQIFTFDQASYGGYNELMIDGDVTEIPYGYSDFDFSPTSIYFYRTNAEGYEPLFERRIGIQVYNTMNGERKASKIVYWPEEENDPDFFVLGNFNGWDIEQAVKFEANDNGALEATIEVLADNEEEREFKIATPDDQAEEAAQGMKWFGGVDEYENNFFLVSEELLSSPIDLVSPGANFRLAEAGNYTIQLIAINNEGSGAPKKISADDNLQIVVIKNDVTAVADLNADRAASVHYVNLAGQVSATPFSGVNIQVTTMNDGSMKAVKVVK